MNNISEMMDVVFGENLGKALFNNLFGLNYQGIHAGISSGFFLLYIFIGGYVIQSNIFSGKLANLIFEKQALLPLVTANSLFLALILISELIRISDKSSRKME